MSRIALRILMLSTAGLVMPATAEAAAFMVRENSAESVATAYAGNASRADDVSTVFNNPAGMSDLQGTQWEVGGVVVAPSVNFKGNATLQGQPISQGAERNAGQLALAPNLYGETDVTDRLKAGIAITAPFGNALDYANDWPGRYDNLKTAAISADINPNLAYKISDQISVGGGVSLQYMKLKLTTGLAQFAIFGPGTPDGEYTLNADNFAVGYNLGILAELFPGTRVGFTYRSGIAHDLKGKLTFSPSTSPLLGLTTAKAKADLDVPATIEGSITQQVTPDFSLSSDIQLAQWHSFQAVNLSAPPNPNFVFQEDYRDSWMITGGGVYQWSDDWTLRAGAGYDESPVTDPYRDTGVPDGNRIMLGLGAGYKFSDGMILDLGYAHYFATAPAKIDSSVNAIDPISGIALHGEYHNHIDYLAVSLKAAL